MLVNTAQASMAQEKQGVGGAQAQYCETSVERERGVLGVADSKAKRHVTAPPTHTVISPRGASGLRG